MIFSEIEQLQREYTDKYVVVDAARPELARFGEVVGQVKTVNFNGRALVEFLDYNSNIGWYDIALNCLTVVPKPDPNVKKEKPAAKAATAKAAPAVKAEKPAAKPAAGGKRLSVADMLAAAHAQGAMKAGGAAPTTEKSTADKPVAAKPATPKPAAAPKPATPAAGGKKPTVAEMLAAARAQGGPKAAAPAETPVDDSAVEEPSTEATVEETPVAAPAAKKGKPSGPLPTTTAEKIQYCRDVDAS
ncbi:MAG: hypothetical protein QM811_15940 [Pirellulales bacterium]